MNLDIQLGASCKSPEVGDVFISDRSQWASAGYFSVVCDPPSEGYPNGQTIPLLFLKGRNCSTRSAPDSIMPVAKIPL